jgi:hypothetical protein
VREPVLRNTVDAQPLQPLPSAAVAMLMGALEAEAVAERAIVSVAVVDCREQRAPGASFSNHLGGRGFYFSDGLPQHPPRTSPAWAASSMCPSVWWRSRRRLETDGRVIGKRNVLPRAGWLTSVQVRPPAAPFE